MDIELYEHYPDEKDCFEYVSDHLNFLNKQSLITLLDGINKTSFKEKGNDNDLVLYQTPIYNDDGSVYDYRKTHCGILINKKVISKWGHYSVIKHPLNLVPTIYGTDVIFLTL